MAATLADDIFKCNYVNENVLISIKIFLRVQLKINHHWLKGNSLVPSHYMNQWWPNPMTHIYVTLPQWVNKQLVPGKIGHTQCKTCSEHVWWWCNVHCHIWANYCWSSDVIPNVNIVKGKARASTSGFICSSVFIMGHFLPNLTHWGLVTPFGDLDLGQHWLR